MFNIKTKTPKFVLMLILALVILSLCATAEAAYNGDKAAKYALEYSSVPNPDYNYFKEDCTNFVSQCLLAGGWKETGKYKFTSKNAWYYDFGKRPGYSNTWAVANSLYAFLNSHPDRAKKQSVYNRPYKESYRKNFKPGDLVQIDYGSDGTWDHSMIITVVSDTDMVVTYHTRNEAGKSLNQIILESPGAKFVGWKIK